MRNDSNFVRGEYAALDAPSGNIIRLVEHKADQSWVVETLDGDRDTVQDERVHEIS